MTKHDDADCPALRAIERVVRACDEALEESIRLTAREPSALLDDLPYIEVIPGESLRHRIKTKLPDISWRDAECP